MLTQFQSDDRKASTKSRREQSIDEIFDDYIQRMEGTMTTEPDAYLQVISVLVAGDTHGQQ